MARQTYRRKSNGQFNGSAAGSNNGGGRQLSGRAKAAGSGGRKASTATRAPRNPRSQTAVARGGRAYNRRKNSGGFLSAKAKRRIKATAATAAYAGVYYTVVAGSKKNANARRAASRSFNSGGLGNAARTAQTLGNLSKAMASPGPGARPMGMPVRNGFSVSSRGTAIPRFVSS